MAEQIENSVVEVSNVDYAGFLKEFTMTAGTDFSAQTGAEGSYFYCAKGVDGNGNPCFARALVNRDNASGDSRLWVPVTEEVFDQLFEAANKSR